MKFKYQLVSLSAAFLISATTLTHAQSGTTWFGDSSDGQWLAGIKYGQVSNDDFGFRDADTYSIILGYQFARPVNTDGTSTLELEYTDSDEASRDTGISGDEWEFESYGLYLTYRTPGTVYFKGRVGLLNSEITSLSNGINVGTDSDTNFAYGAGFGIVLGENQNVNLELDWTAGSGDNDVSLVNFGGYIRF